MLNLSNNQDVIQEIMSHLTIKDLLNLSQVSKQLLQLANAPIVWKRMLEKEGMEPKQNPKQEYIHQYKCTLLKKQERNLLKDQLTRWGKEEGKYGLYNRLVNNKEAVLLLMEDQSLMEKLNWHPLDLKTLCGLHQIDYQHHWSNQTESIGKHLQLSR